MIIGKKYGYLDPKKEAKWFEWEDGVSLLIAPANNHAYSKYMVENMSSEALEMVVESMTEFDENDSVEEAEAKVNSNVEKRLSNGTADLKKLMASVDTIRKACANTILLDWKGFQEEVGEEVVELKYSPEKAMEYINGYPVLFTFVQDKANELSGAKSKVAEDTKKN